MSLPCNSAKPYFGFHSRFAGRMSFSLQFGKAAFRVSLPLRWQNEFFPTIRQSRISGFTPASLIKKRLKASINEMVGRIKLIIYL